MDNQPLVCSVCHEPVAPTAYFCANCGNNLKEKVAPIALMTQLGLYALSIFLPPFGLWPGLKYLAKKNPYARRVGLVVVVLTVLSTALTIWAIFAMADNYLNLLNSAVSGL